MGSVVYPSCSDQKVVYLMNRSMLTVKQLSKLAGVTPRTLHHYDQIGLLKPSRVGANGYRYYGEESVLQLQQILFYRELGIPLEDIKQIMGRRDFDVLDALRSHKEALQRQATRLNRLINTVDNTINHLNGNTTMSDKAYFEGFSEEEQEKYAAEAEQLYDPETVRESNRKWKSYSTSKKESIMAEGKAIYMDMIAAMPKGPESPEVQKIVERWRKHMDYFWTPKLDQLLALANGYNDNPRFKANFDRMHPQLAGFIREAVKIYVEKKQK
jgi:MerR family transcriptional regulator, thiopeptide resistance regulator